MTIAGGAIAGNSSSAAFLVSGGTVNFSYGGSITQANSQRAVDVEGATANTISLGGSVNGNSSTGVFLNNNTGATVSFLRPQPVHRHEYRFHCHRRGDGQRHGLGQHDHHHYGHRAQLANTDDRLAPGWSSRASRPTGPTPASRCPAPAPRAGW